MSSNQTTWTREALTPLEIGLEKAASLFPNKIAVHYRVWHPQGKNKPVKVDEWKSCTYAAFWARVTTLSNNVLKYGAKPGDRALVFWIPPSQMDVLALMFGLLKAGVVIVWLDPRTMKFSELLNNIELIKPRVLFADKVVRRVFRTLQAVGGRLKSIQIVMGSRELAGNAPVKAKSMLSGEADQELDMDGGVIMFTTGSTGPPKAVRITGQCLAGQADAYEAVARESGLGGPGELIAVHTGMNFNALDLALGNTTVTLPDPANPGKISPEWIEEVDSLFHPSVITASRIVYENLVQAAANPGRQQPYLPHLRLAFSGGAPVTPTLHDAVCRALPNLTDFFSAYGCTEGLPLMVSGWRSTYGGALTSEVSEMSTRQGYGVSLGQLCSHVEIFILNLDKAKELDALAQKTRVVQTWKEDEYACRDGEMGELVIRSPSVSPRYVNHPLANAASKFVHPTGNPPMHRTGDLVFRDGITGQVWMMGRVAQAVSLGSKKIPPVCIESIFDGADGVRRCAFVGAQSKRTKAIVPVLVVLRTAEARKSTLGFDEKVYREKLGASKMWRFLVEDAGIGLKIMEYRVAEEFPMDKRHNSKIRREILAQWASKFV